MTPAGKRAAWFVAAFTGAGLIVAVATFADGSSSAPESATSTGATVPVVEAGEAAGARSEVLTEVTPSGPGPLPRPDLESYCMERFGPDSMVTIVQPDVRSIRCVSRAAAGGEVQDIDVQAACQTQFGAASRALTVDESTDGWRCTPDPAARVRLGAADPQPACAELYGTDARAVLVAGDQDGWRCAAVRNGLFGLEWSQPDLPGYFDLSCQLSYASEAFASAHGTTPESWACYGATTS